jgi:hypothetical protein
MTSIFLQMEDDLNIFPNGRQPNFFLQMEDDLNFFENGRRPQSFGKWQTISIFRKWKMT